MLLSRGALWGGVMLFLKDPQLKMPSFLALAFMLLLGSNDRPPC